MRYPCADWTRCLLVAVTLATLSLLGACSQQASLEDTLKSVIVTPSPPGPVVAPIAKTPIVASSVAAAEIALSELEKLALRYTTLPECGPASPRTCHDPAIKARIKEYDSYAFNAVMAARRGAGSLESAVKAISALQSILP